MKAEQSLAGDQEGRAKKLVAKCQVRLRPLFLSPEAGRSALLEMSATIKLIVISSALKNITENVRSY